MGYKYLMFQESRVGFRKNVVPLLTRNESAMYFRKKTSGGRAYLQIVESRREGAQVRQQVVATLGTTYFNFTLFGCFCCEVFSMCLNYTQTATQRARRESPSPIAARARHADIALGSQAF